MITDARDVVDGDRLRTDVCVIGGGAAGITIARELRGSGLDVIVLEGGGFEPDPGSTELYDAEVVGEIFGTPDAPVPLTEVRLRYLGGTTNHWAGYCRPQDPAALEPRPHRARSGWPVSADELRRWYEHVSPMFAIDTFAFDWRTWDEELGLGQPVLPDGDYTTVVNQTRPIRFGQAFRADLEAAADVRVLVHANATEVLVDDNSDVVSGVAVAVTDGPRFEVGAKAVVVALGGIENPRMLLASRSVRTAGLGNERDLVGRHFCEHPQADIALVTLSQTPEELGLYRQSELEGNPFFGTSAVMVAGPEVIDRHELLGFDAGLIPLAWPDQPTTPGLSVAEVAKVAELTGTGPPGSTCILRALPEQELNPASRVVLSRRRDALGVPELQLDWRFSEIDRRSILTHVRLVARELGQRGIGRVQLVPDTMVALGADEIPVEGEPGAGGYLSTFRVDPSLADPEGFHLAYGCHHMCTTRMATSPSEGVVDTDLRVHGLANLYVAGGSVFPVAGTAPPTFTIVALAARLADHLRTVVAA